MKDCSELPKNFVTFYNEILVQFDKRIKIFCSDNTLEYVQSIMHFFYAKYGIIRQTSYPHTSQQNGTVERQHRHILDVARTLMFNMRVPNHY